MSKAYISVCALRRFIANIAAAPVVARSSVDYLLAVKDGKIYRVAGSAAPYLRVSPEEVQWVYPQVVYYEVESNTSWTVG